MADETTPLAPAPDTRDLVIEAIRGCFEPEIPVNIYDVGLILRGEDRGQQGLREDDAHLADVPGRRHPPHRGQNRVQEVAGIESAEIDLVWDPPWSPAKLSEAAKLQLGM